MPPSITRATRSSPRKIAQSRYDSSSDEEEEISVLVPKSSRRDLRNVPNFSQEAHSALGLTPRKQRILRPVESNSRLLRKLSDESLASPEKKQRERRVRSSTIDTDVGKKTRLLYAKTLAKSVVKKQASRAKIDVLGREELRLPERKKAIVEEAVEVEAEEEEDVETSLWCGDEDATPQDKGETPVIEISDDDEDPVVDSRQRRQQPQTRRVESNSEDEDDEVEVVLPVLKTSTASSEQHAPAATSALEPKPLTSMRPPHRKGHSTISNWAQEVVDLTDSPEAPSLFVAPPLSPPSRMRTASFASSRPQTSSSNGGRAMLVYSPTPTKQRSPLKAPPISRPITPPPAPPSPSKLVSPSKKKPAIPKAPDLRPSLDAFWNPEIVNEWNEKHSPVKPLVSPKKQKWRDDIVKMMEGIALEDSDDSASEAEVPSPTTSPHKKNTKDTTSRSPVKKLVLDSAAPDVKAVRAERKAFVTEREAMASAFLTELDNTICAGRIHSLSQSTGGIHLVWSSTLRSTAGRANWRRETIRMRTGPNATDFSTAIRHHCSIELAIKVIDTPERLYNVLAHEFCHLTTFMISDVRNNPHGAEFKSWGRRVSEAFADRGVEVTTKHSYAIEYKFVWECVACGYEFKRHSKSVDTARHSCGRCKGKLVQTKPVPRGGKGGVGGEKKEKSEYQVFVKANFSRVKKELVEEGKDAQMGKVMEAVAREYRDMKAANEVEKRLNVGGELEDALEGLKI